MPSWLFNYVNLFLLRLLGFRLGTNKSEFIRLECHLDETYLGFPVTIFGLTGKRTTLTIGGNDDIISDTRGTRSLFLSWPYEGPYS